ncbi:tyrosine-type recombinase/integrase [Pseudaestuariivita rosea]|uniref:tyrosine-type recombinase/integrase n=1 Tax=Pseudaestuariivita rosea TaxID=2763263 RepID=UPI001ABB51E6|nr:site-specific integrase [Pseudaestuariivita rosea]
MDGVLPSDTCRRVKSGPHVEKKLNAAFVRSAGPGRHADGGGLFLQVDRSGARRWVLRITVQGKRRDLGLGSAKLISLAEAREKSLEYRKIAKSGGDPTLRKRADDGRAIRVADLARKVHAQKFKDNVNNGKHVAQWIRTLETYAFPVIGDMSVEDVLQDDIETILDPIWTTKPETAQRVLQRLKTVFDFACGRGYRTRGNPADGLRNIMRKQNSKPKHFEAIDYGEIAKLMYELRQSNAIGSLALQFTILTVVRSGAVRKATWDQFDSSWEHWTIPAENMKMREEFVVPLPVPARDILWNLSQKPHAQTDLVFPSPSNPRKPLSENTMRKLLQTHCPGKTVHGTRATFRTWAREELKERDDIAEMALAHKIGSNTQLAYNRAELLYDRLMLLEKWALWVHKEMEFFCDGGQDADKDHMRRTLEREINTRQDKWYFED